MNIFAKLFGSEKVIEGVYNGLDKVIHTDEEKSDFWLKLLKAYEPFKIAQRYIALVVTIPYVSIWIISALLLVSSVFTVPCESVCKSNQLKTVSIELAEKNQEQLGMPVALILGFYFGGGAVEGVARTIAARRKQ